MKKYIVWIVLISILVLAGFLRFYHLKEKGLFFYDEGIYLCSAKAKLDRLNITPQNLIIGLDNKTQGPIPNFTSGSKFGYVFFVFLSFVLFGIREYSSLIVSAFFGLATVFLVFITARRIYNQYTALFASLIIAVSAIHVMYSRHGLPMAESIFFLYLGWHLYILSLPNKNFWLFPSGLSIGYAVTSHYNLFPFIAVFLIFEIINLIQNKKIITFRIFNLLVSVLIPFLMWQILSLNKSIFLVTYFGELKSSFSAIAEQVKYGIDPFFALYYLQKMEGWLVFLAFIFGSIYIAGRIKKNFNLAELTLLILAVFPILWYGFYPHMRVLRSFSPMLPALAIVVSKSLIDFADWRLIKRFKSIFMTIFIIAVIGFGIYSCWPIINLKSSYRNIAQYIYENNGKLISQEMEMYPIFVYYLGADVMPIKKLKDLKVIKDDQNYFLISIWTFNKELKDMKPFRIFQQPSFPAFNAEGGSKDKYLMRDIPVKEIRLYKIRDLFVEF